MCDDVDNEYDILCMTMYILFKIIDILYLMMHTLHVMMYVVYVHYESLVWFDINDTSYLIENFLSSYLIHSSILFSV